MESKDGQKQTRLDALEKLFQEPVQVAYEFTGAGLDGHLQDLVDIVNKSTNELTFDISLFTSSGVVSGTLISVKRYFREFGASMRQGLDIAFPDDDWQSVEDGFRARGDGSRDLPEDDNYDPSPQFIHLTNAYLHTPNGKLPTAQGFLWRGKLSAIDGHFLGQLKTDS